MDQSVNTRNALFAPLAASISLFGTYFLLKSNFDIATVYQVRACVCAWEPRMGCAAMIPAVVWNISPNV